MSSTSPTQLSLRYLRAAGYLCQVAEYWNPFANRRIDLFGFGDIVAVHPDDREIALVQTTTANHINERYAKIAADDRAEKWLSAGGLIFLHGWYKRERKWRVREEFLEMELPCEP